MLKAKEIYNAFFNIVKTIVISDSVNTVKKTDIKTISDEDYNCVQVVLGADNRDELSTSLHEYKLSIYTDIHAQFIEKFSSDEISVDDITLDIRALIHTALATIPELNLDYVFRVAFVGQSQPQYNAESAEHVSSTRLEWQITYFSDHNGAY